MRRRGGGLLAVGLGFLAGLLVACVLLAVLLAPKNRVVARWDAPGDVYHALIVDDGPSPTALLGSLHRWRLYLGRDAQTPSYGHFVSLPELPDLYGEDGPKWQESRVNWTPAGVRFSFWTGHELFVPARAYENGR
ncbi:hypothetical protein DAETH_21180 [Deinococcus aetherius]|uniref:Uncharacterized protein n=1 Tax=Deinococcus aetherius TaxID=200252 RepID=A0ABM8AED0_9DEIO|nr:hypothetical protein [Deinococcus aetherius]BDP42149.1 hypothetical protein DAETH_21180 [Deinococcus aetherius]